MFLAPCKLAQTPSLRFLNPFFHSLPMAAPSESSLISKLQSSDSSGIHALVSDYLRPLADLKATKKSKPEPTLICSLAKRFLSFLNASRGFPSPTTPFCYSNCSAFTGSASIAWTPSLLSWLPSHSPSNSRDFASCTVSSPAHSSPKPKSRV